MLLLIFLECLTCLLIWWGGMTLAVADQPERRSWDALQRQRRAEWVRTERRGRSAILWTILMGVVLVVVVALTEHFALGIRPVGL